MNRYVPLAALDTPTFPPPAFPEADSRLLPKEAPPPLVFLGNGGGPGRQACLSQLSSKNVPLQTATGVLDERSFAAWLANFSAPPIVLNVHKGHASAPKCIETGPSASGTRSHPDIVALHVSAFNRPRFPKEPKVPQRARAYPLCPSLLQGETIHSQEEFMPHVGRHSTTLCLARLSRLCLDDISAIGLSRVQRPHHFCAQSERTPTTFGVHGSLFTPSARKQASTMADEYALLAKIPSAERHRWVAHEHRRRVARGSFKRPRVTTLGVGAREHLSGAVRRAPHLRTRGRLCDARRPTKAAERTRRCKPHR